MEFEEEFDVEHLDIGNRLAPGTEEGKPGNKLVWCDGGKKYEGPRNLEHIGVLWHFNLDPKDVIAYAMIDDDGDILWDTDQAKLVTRRGDWAKLLYVLRRAEPEAAEEILRVGVEKGWHNAVRIKSKKKE